VLLFGDNLDLRCINFSRHLDANFVHVLTKDCVLISTSLILINICFEVEKNLIVVCIFKIDN
jgi:hypothetical protein